MLLIILITGSAGEIGRAIARRFAENAAGGVGSIAIQLAKLAKLKVIATASREETTA